MLVKWFVRKLVKRLVNNALGHLKENLEAENLNSINFLESKNGRGQSLAASGK